MRVTLLDESGRNRCTVFSAAITKKGNDIVMTFIVIIVSCDLSSLRLSSSLCVQFAGKPVW